MNMQGTEMPPNHTASAAAGAAPHPLDPPGPGYGLRSQVGGNGLAVAAMVLGAVGLTTSIVFVGGLFGVIGLILGILALRTAGRTGVRRGMSIAGVVTSFVAIVLSVLMAFFLAWYANRTQACYQPDDFRQYRQCVHQQFTGH